MSETKIKNEMLDQFSKEEVAVMLKGNTKATLLEGLLQWKLVAIQLEAANKRLEDKLKEKQS